MDKDLAQNTDGHLPVIVDNFQTFSFKKKIQNILLSLTTFLLQVKLDDFWTKIQDSAVVGLTHSLSQI